LKENDHVQFRVRCGQRCGARDDRADLPDERRRNKIPNFQGVAGYMASEGVPAPQVMLAGAIVF